MPTDHETGEKHDFDDGGYGARFCQRRVGSNAHSGICCGQPHSSPIHSPGEPMSKKPSAPAGERFPAPCPTCGAARWVEDVCACSPRPAAHPGAEPESRIGGLTREEWGRWYVRHVHLDNGELAMTGMFGHLLAAAFAPKEGR